MVASFDYKGFAKELTKQAESVIPEDIAVKCKKDFLEKIYNYTYLAGEAFSTDEAIDSSATAKVLTQVISEWTFHKYVDLLRSSIPETYHESILQKLAYVAYEMAKESALSNLSQDEMLKLVEIQLKKVYVKSCKQLLDNGRITQDDFNKAVSLSNIDSMEYKNESKEKSTFYLTLSAMIYALVVVGMNLYGNFSWISVFNFISVIILSLYVGFYFGVNTRIK